MNFFSEVQVQELNVVLALVFLLCASVSRVSFYSGILYQEVAPLPCVHVLGLVNLLQRYSKVLSLGRFVQGRFFCLPLVQVI